MPSRPHSTVTGTSSSTPFPLDLRRTMSSQSGLRSQSSSTVQAASTGSLPDRRRSGQQRLDDILQVATQRADSMNLHGTSAMSPERLHPVPGAADEPDERTNIMAGTNRTDYLSTRASSTTSLRNRQPASRLETDPGSGAAAPNAEKKHWLWHHVDGVWSFELENKGSVARDHLALERTFLAWLRTSLAFASIGVAVTQLFRLNAALVDEQTQHRLQRLGAPLGSAFIGISILVLLLGYHRFYQPQQWLLKGKFPASRGAIILISFLSFALMLASLLIVVILQPATQ